MKRLSKSQLFFFVCVGLIGGFSLCAYEGSFVYVVLIAALALCVGIFLFCIKINPASVYVAICAVFVCIGFAYAHAWSSQTYEKIQFGRKIVIEAVVSSYPRMSDFGVGFLVKTKYGNLQTYVPFSDEVEYGDKLVIEGIVEELTDTQAYLKKDLVLGIIKNPSVETRIKGDFSLTRFLYSIRTHIRDMCIKIFPYDEASLAAGLLIGGGSVSFSQEFKEHMQNSGTTHIVALSGYNISIIIVWVYALCGTFLKRGGTFWVTTAFVALFVCMTGAEASVVRASIMSMLMLIAQHKGRIYDFKQSTALVACGMLLINPLTIRYDVGFILSFLSLFGIVYIAPVGTYALKRFSWAELKFVKTAIETISAQLAVFPVLGSLFGGFSIVGVLANVCILPIVPYAMGSSFLVLGMGIVSGSVARVLSFIASPLLFYSAGIIHIFGSFPRRHISVSGIGLTVLYVTLAIGLWYIHKKWNIKEYA